jgi:hypothetical protein
MELTDFPALCATLEEDGEAFFSHGTLYAQYGLSWQQLRKLEADGYVEVVSQADGSYRIDPMLAN